MRSKAILMLPIFISSIYPCLKGCGECAGIRATGDSTIITGSGRKQHLIWKGKSSRIVPVRLLLPVSITILMLSIT